MNKSPLLSINIVFVKSSIKYLDLIMKSVKSQLYDNYELNIMQNVDYDLKRVINSYGFKNVNIIQKIKMAGFCENHNDLINISTGEVVFIVNPDVYLNDNYLLDLLQIIEPDDVAAATGTLLRLNNDLTLSETTDSQGMRLTPFQRHKDINAGKIYIKQRMNTILKYRIWGVSGAALLIKRAALDDVRLTNGDYFDERFFMGREDADLAYRLNMRNWKALYYPRAIAYHHRTTKENNRTQQSAHYNYHQVKNRFILRFNNISFPVLLLLSPFLLFRDILIVGYCILFERESLASFNWIIHNMPSLLNCRNEIQKNKKSTFWDELKWYFIKYENYRIYPK